MEKVWHSVFYNDLQVDPETRSVLLTECPGNPAYNREQTIRSMFEQFNVAAAYITSSSQLSLLSHGTLTGMVVDLGLDCGFVTPVKKFNIISDGCKRLDMAGDAITTCLQRLLNEERHYEMHDRKKITDVKESLCFVAQDFDAEMKEYENKTIDKDYESPIGQKFQLGS